MSSRRDQVDARVALIRAVGQLGQLEVELPRQVLADLADLILDDVIVVAQPVFRGDRLRIGARDGRQVLVGVFEARGALVEARQQRPGAARVGGKRMRRRQRLRVRLQLFEIEEWRRGRLDLRLKN